MSSEESVDIIGVGDQLREEIQSGEFDRFVVFTYGITQEYLEWFEESDLIAICGPNKTVEAVRESAASPFVSAFNRQTHAKIYLLYNDSKIVAYLGSFNFTRDGLYGNVEWGVRYEGEFVEEPPNPSELVDGDARTEILTSPVIEQILTVVGASMTGEDTDAADSWVANTGLGEGVVHTLRSNTLQTAFSDMLRGVEGTVELQYYSPFVTYRGVTEFVSYLPDDLPESDIELTVLTKRLDRVRDDKQMLTPENVDVFDKRFGAFRLRARAPGNQGNELPDGRELRSGMAHLKTIVLSERAQSSTEKLGVILTSANLSKRAWSRTSAGFEVGVALTGTRDSRRLHRFFTEILPQCYVNPSDLMLSTTGEETARSHGTEEWLNERLRDRMTIDSDAVSVEWDDTLPELEAVEGKISIRNIATGARSNHSVAFESTDEGYIGSFPSVSAQPNQIIDFARIVAQSSHAPPELVYSAREIRELRAELGIEEDSDPLPGDWLEFDEIIWNNDVRTPVDKAGFDDVDTIKSVRLVSNYESAEPHYSIHEPEHQPHIDTVITGTKVEERQVAPFGTLVRLSIDTHPLISLDSTDLRFYTSQRHQVQSLGFATDGETLRYYFSPDVVGESLQIRLQSLIARYIQSTSTEVATDGVTADSTVDISEHASMDPWDVAPKDADPVLSKSRSDLPEFLQSEDETGSGQVDISDKMEAVITPPDDLVTTYSPERFAVWWQPSRTFQSGTIQSVSESIPKQEPRTRVTYRGVVTFQDGSEEINIWLPGGEYLVKEQPFVDTLGVSLTAIPTEQDITRIRPNRFLGWIVLQQNELLHLRASDVAHCIHAQLYVDGEKVPRQIFNTTTSGGFFCIPVLGEHVGSSIDVSLRLWISGGPAKTAQYAEAVRKFDLTVTRDGADLNVEFGGQDQHITDVANGESPLLEPFADVIQQSEFEGQTRADYPDEIFRIQSYEPLHIIPKEMLILHFTDR